MEDKFNAWFYGTNEKSSDRVKSLDHVLDGLTDYIEVLCLMCYNQGWNDHMRAQEALEELTRLGEEFGEY